MRSRIFFGFQFALNRLCLEVLFVILRALSFDFKFNLIRFFLKFLSLVSLSDVIKRLPKSILLVFGSALREVLLD